MMQFTVELSVLQEILKAIEGFAKDVNFYCYNEKSLRIQAYPSDKDTKNHILADALLTFESSGGVIKANIWRNPEEEPVFMRLRIRKISFGLDRIAKYFRDYFRKEDITILVSILPDTDGCHFSMQAQDSDQCSAFWVRKRTVCHHIPYTIPSECLPASAIMSATDILGICTKVSHWVEDDGHTIIPQTEISQFSIANDNSMDHNAIDRDLVQEVTTSLFHMLVCRQIQLKYLKYFTEAETTTSKVTIRSGSGYPLVVEYKIAEADYIKFYLGRRHGGDQIEDDDSQDSEDSVSISNPVRVLDLDDPNAGMMCDLYDPVLWCEDFLGD